MTETDNGADGEISSTLTGVSPRVRPRHQKRTMVARRMAERKTWAHGRSGLQWAASPSLGKRASRLCDACDPASCGHGLAACGSDGTGRDARRDPLLGQHLADFVSVIPLIPKHRGSRRQILQHLISASEVTALPFPLVQTQRTTFAVADPMELAGHAPLGATDQAEGNPPLLSLDAVE